MFHTHAKIPGEATVLYVFIFSVSESKWDGTVFQLNNNKHFQNSI